MLPIFFLIDKYFPNIIKPNIIYNYTRKKKFCKICGKEIDRQATLCLDCYNQKTSTRKSIEQE